MQTFPGEVAHTGKGECIGTEVVDACRDQSGGSWHHPSPYCADTLENIWGILVLSPGNTRVFRKQRAMKARYFVMQFTEVFMGRLCKAKPYPSSLPELMKKNLHALNI